MAKVTTPEPSDNTSSTVITTNTTNNQPSDVNVNNVIEEVDITDNLDDNTGTSTSTQNREEVPTQGQESNGATEIIHDSRTVSGFDDDEFKEPDCDCYYVVLAITLITVLFGMAIYFIVAANSNMFTGHRGDFFNDSFFNDSDIWYNMTSNYSDYINS